MSCETALRSHRSGKLPGGRRLAANVLRFSKSELEAFASQALAAGVSLFELARIMGTSVRMIERHYGTLLQGSGDAEGEAVSAP